MSSTGEVPPPPPSMTSSLVINEGDSDADKATKIRYQAMYNNGYTSAWVQTVNVYTDTVKLIGG